MCVGVVSDAADQHMRRNEGAPVTPKDVWVWCQTWLESHQDMAVLVRSWLIVLLVEYTA